jgi:hypothetical protein
MKTRLTVSFDVETSDKVGEDAYQDFLAGIFAGNVHSFSNSGTIHFDEKKANVQLEKVSI